MNRLSALIRLLAFIMLGLALPATQLFAQGSGQTPEKVLHYADSIVVNSNIVTMDNTEILSEDPGSIVQAMAIRDGKILDLGSNTYIRSLAGPNTRMMDVKGKTVIPGLIETHVHPESTLNEMPSVAEVRDAYQWAPGRHTAVRVEENPAQTLTNLSQMLAEYPPRPGEWVHVLLVTYEEHLDYPDIAALTAGIYNNLFTSEDLTRAVPNNPASIGSGDSPSAVMQPGLMIRVTVGPDRKSIIEPLRAPTALNTDQKKMEIVQGQSPFHEIFRQNKEKQAAESLHAHVEQGCGWAEADAHHGQHCSHRVIVLNKLALEETVKVWPGFANAANNMMTLTENAGDRALVGGVFQESEAWSRSLFPPRVPKEIYNQWMKDVMVHYAEGGLTMIASSLEEGRSMTSFYQILREDKRLPVRFGYGYEVLRSPLLYPTQPQLPIALGSHWGPIEANPWFWPMGITDGGSGDSRRVACFAQDLPGPDKVKAREWCMNDEAYRIKQLLIPAIANGWRLFSSHAFGSHQFRLHAEWVEEARIKGSMTMDEIRDLRIGFAHGGAVGKIPDVIEIMKNYNFYVPIRPSDVAESLIQVKRYGPEGLEFLAPTKTLLEAGVKVVGEGGHELNPSIYSRDLSMFVTRQIKDPSDEGVTGEVVMPEEAVSRVTAMRLYTSRAAEWLFAENVTGTLEAGNLADFVVIDKDYFSVPVAQIEDNKMLMTVVGDKVIYQDANWQPGSM
ncbi:MAG: amidohydrolase family protein [Gammaproteobacteria bacterium]